MNDRTFRILVDPITGTPSVDMMDILSLPSLLSRKVFPIMNPADLYPVPAVATPSDLDRYEGIRDAAQQLARTILECCPDTPHRTIALARLEIAVGEAYAALGPVQVGHGG